MLLNDYDSKTWKTALKMEGLDKFQGHMEDHELDAVQAAMGILTQEGIEIHNALQEHLESNDAHSAGTLENTVGLTHLSRLFVRGGESLEEYARLLLDKLD